MLVTFSSYKYQASYDDASLARMIEDAPGIEGLTSSELHRAKSFSATKLLRESGWFDCKFLPFMLIPCVASLIHWWQLDDIQKEWDKCNQDLHIIELELAKIDCKAPSAAIVPFTVQENSNSFGPKKMS